MAAATNFLIKPAEEDFKGTEQFLIQRRLGKGGFGVVYQTYDRERNTVVALKTLRQVDAASLYRFKREFRELAGITHQNLVSLYELLSDGEQWFFCDVKPSNVLVTSEGRVVLLDFGLVTDLDPQLLKKDRERQIIGTPAYMAPEQMAGATVSEASDWYSLGMMLYEALTGHSPFSGSFHQMSLEKQNSDPPLPSALAPAIPQDLDDLCQRLLRRNPRDRPSGREVLSRLGCDRASHSSVLPTRAYTAQTAPFVGRERHLATLAEAFQSMKEGRPAVVCLLGGSGMGKSALARRFLEELRRREEVVTLQGRCYEQESVPYKGFDSIVDDLSQYLKSLPIREAEALIPPGILALTRMFPVLSWVEVLAAARRDEIEIPNSHERRKRAFAALRELLDRLASHLPTGELRLDSVIQARISGLPDGARRLLEVVAVAGQPIRIEAAKLASDLVAGEQAALAILRSGHMIRSRETDEQDEIEAYHDRIREMVVAGISAEALKMRHHHLAVASE